MGGQLSVVSEEGTGSTFSFEVAIHDAVEQPAAPPDLNGTTLCVAVASARERQAIVRWMQVRGAKVCEVADRSALAQVMQSFDTLSPRPSTDYWVIELGLGNDAENLLAMLSSHPSNRIIPLVSADQLAQEVSLLEKFRIDGHVTRPVVGAEVLDVLKRVRPISPSEGAMATQPPPEQLQNMKILVAEDNPINQRLIAEILKKMGHQYEIAENGRLAVECLQAEPNRFDLVLMDMQMPEMDGLSATREIRRLERDERAAWGRIPIVALTANALPGDEQRCLDAGMDAYLTKPVRQQLLRAMLEKFGARNIAGIVNSPPAAVKPAEQTSETSVSSAANPTAEPAVDVARALEQLGDDRELLVTLVGLFCDDGPRHWHDLRAAISDGNAPGARRHAHSLKGLFGTFAADQALAIAKQIELDAQNGQLEAAAAGLPALQAALAAVFRELAAAAGLPAPQFP